MADGPTLSRRRVLEMLSLSSVGGLAGCSGRDGAPTDTQIRSPTAPSTNQTDTQIPSAAGAKFELGNLRYPASITEGELVSVSFRVENVGGQTGQTTIVVEVAHRSVTLDVELESGASETVTADIGFVETTGNLTVSVVEQHTGNTIRGDLHVEPRTRYYVSPEGSDTNPGSKDRPINTIQEGLNRAQPGETVHALPGRYHERVETVRPGKPNHPITLTGPPDAVFLGGDETPFGEPLKILHSHVYVLGMTFDGLQNPQRPDDVSKDDGDGAAYAKGNISVNPFTFLTRRDEPDETADKFPGYVRDVKIKPHAVGNVLGAMINTFFANDVEIGEFRVIGPGGLKHLKGEVSGHNGEVVYIGTPYPKFRSDKEPDTVIEGADLDESHDYHVHHIDNSEGHPHAELVDVKGGAYNVTVEYCTDAGNGAHYRLSDHGVQSESAIRLEGRNCVFRWSIVENSLGNGVETWHWCIANPDQCDWYDELPKAPEKGEQNYDIYGNRLLDNDGLAVKFNQGPDHPSVGPDGFTTVCGNEYNGDTHGEPDNPCDEDFPQTDTIGHLGGDSPWN